MSVGNFPKFAASAALVLGLAGSAAQAGVTLSTGGGPSTGPDVSYQNFDAPIVSGQVLAPTGGNTGGASVTVTFAGNAQATTGNTDGIAATPYVTAGSGAKFGDSDAGHKDATQYLTAGTGSVTLAFSSGQHYLGLLWGSVDSYNELDLYNKGVLVGHITGGDVKNPANGDQGVNGSVYVNINSTVAFTSAVVHENAANNKFAFEFDNVAYSAVPEPASLVMSGMALLAVTGVALRRKAKAAQA